MIFLFPQTMELESREAVTLINPQSNDFRHPLKGQGKLHDRLGGWGMAGPKNSPGEPSSRGNAADLTNNGRNEGMLDIGEKGKIFYSMVLTENKDLDSRVIRSKHRVYIVVRVIILHCFSLSEQFFTQLLSLKSLSDSLFSTD